MAVPRFSLTASVLLTLIIVVGTFFRLHLLGTRSLLRDEAASVAFVRLPWTTFWNVLWNREGNMALYYLLLRGWIHLGYSEFAIRSLSVMFGVATIVAVYLLGNRFLDRKTGLTSAALLTVHNFHIVYSREARSYSLLLFLLVLSTYFFLRSIESPHEKKYWMAYVLVSVLAVYAQVFAVPVLVSQWLSLGCARFRQVRLATILWTTVTSALLVSPMAAFVLLKDKGQIDWIHQPTRKMFLNSMQLLTGNFFTDSSNNIQRSALLILYGGFWTLAVLHLALRGRSKSAGIDQSSVITLIALWLVFPIALTLFISFRKPLFVARYMLICVPAMVLLAGCGMTALGRVTARLRWVFPLALVVMIGLSVGAVYRYYVLTCRQSGWPSVAHEIIMRQQPNDAAIFLVQATQPFEYWYYVQREMAENGIKSSPTVVFPPGLGVEGHLHLGRGKKQVEVVTKGHRRLWLIWGEEKTDRAIRVRSLIPEDFRLSGEQQFPGVAGDQVDEQQFFRGADQVRITVALYARVPNEEKNQQ